MPSEPLDEQNLNDDDEDIELEVDSPVHSPAARRRSLSPDGHANDDHLDEDDFDDVLDKDEDEPVPRKKRHIEVPPKDDGEAPEVTHCHHNGGQSHYTMRPYNEGPMMMTLKESTALPTAADYSAHLRPPTQMMGKIPESYMPMLHVRRDLHQKSTMPPTMLAPPSVTVKPVHPNESVPMYTGSIPFRKRPHSGFSRELPQTMTSGSFQTPMPPHHINPLNLSGGHHHVAKTNDRPPSMPATDAIHMSSSMVTGVKPETTRDVRPMRSPVPSPVVIAQAPSLVHPQPVQPQPQAAPRRTGFSIEDIMRR